MARVRYLTENDKPPKLTWAFIKRILSYFKPYHWQLSGVVALLMVTSVLGLAPTLLLRRIVDVALPGQDIPMLAILVGLSVLATVVLNLLQVAQGYLSTWTAKRITFSMKNQMFRHLSYMPTAFFATAKPGNITTRMNSDIDGIQEVFRSTVVSALNSVFVLGTTLFALFAMNWKLALIGLATVPLFILPTRKVGKLRWEITSQSQQKLGDLNSIVQESLSSSGSTLMKLCTAEPQQNEAFETLNGEVTALQVKETLAGRWFRMAMAVFTTIGPMLVYFVGGVLLTRGEMTIGGILTFASLLTRLYGPVTSISNLHIDFMRSFALFGRIFEYLDMDNAITDTPDAADLAIERGTVTFDDVTFSYNDDRKALDGVTFAAQAGETIALVGPSGAGKSTVTNLLLRLYDAQSGAIAIDGVNVHDRTLASLRDQVGMVTQEAYLFNGTVRDNLLFGNEGSTERQMVDACKAAYIHDFIQSLPDGYDTQVGNRGVKLSGGEKQRMSIARTILKNPKILILDEATSALDSLSEYYIQRAMVPLLKDRTALVIAHRLSTVVGADRIVVLDEGRIVQQGSHRELLAQGGLYKELYDTQFNKDKTEAA